MKIITEVGNWLNNNQGVVSVILFLLTLLVAWVAGLLKWLRYEVGKTRKSSKIIYVWSLLSENEDSEFYEYKFAPRFQNKTDEIIKDFWVNFASSGFELSVDTTSQTALFDGWNVRNDALHLTSKDTYKFAPQNFVEPFEITIKLRKALPEHDAWLYISYGVPDSKKIVLNYRLTYKDLKRFIKGKNHSAVRFFEYVGMTRKSYLVTKLFRLFLK